MKINTRSMPMKPGTMDDKAHKVHAIVSTEEPATIFDWERWDFVDEILLAKGMILPQANQVPFLDAHNRQSTEDILGSVRDFTVAGNAVEADVYFDTCPMAVECETKVRNGHLTDLSVGYEVLDSVYIPAKESAFIDGREFKGPLKVTRQWKCKEVSAVPIGADENAKFRSEQMQEEIRTIVAQLKREGMLTEDKVRSIMQEMLDKQKATPEPGVAATEDQSKTQQKGAIIMAEKEKELTPEDKQRQEAERKSSIEKAGKDFGARIPGGQKRMDALVADAIKLEIPFEQFRGTVYDLLSRESSEPIDTTAANIGLSEKEISNYSVSRAIMALLDKENCPEKEISQDIAKRMKETGLAYKPEGILIPRAIRMLGLRGINHALQRREMNTASTTAGGNLVATNLLASEFTQMLRPKLLRDRLGVRYLPGVVGNFSIPRQTGASTFAIVAQSNASAESALTFGSVPFSPKEASIWVEYSRRLLAQSTPGIDQIVNEDLNLQTELGWEHEMFHGAGTLAPTGIEITTGVGSIVNDGASIGRPGIVDFKTQLRSANAEIGGISAVANPTTVGLLQSTPEQLNWPKYLISDDDKMMGTPVENTTNVDEGYLFYGVFSTVLMPDWDVYDLIVNQYSKDKEGIIRVSLRTMRDVGVKQPSALVMAASIS